MRWSSWLCTVAPPGTPPGPRPVDDPPVLALLHASPRRRAGPCAIASIRSLSLTRSSFTPRITVSPLGEGRDDRQDRVFVDHRGRALRRHLDPRHVGREPRAQVGHRLAPLLAQVLVGQVRAHLAQRREQPGAGRVQADVRAPARPSPRRSARRRPGRRREDGSRGTAMVCGAQLGLPGQGDDAALVGRPRSRSRRRSPPASARYGRASPRARSPRSRPGAFSPASSTADFTCAEGTGTA